MAVDQAADHELANDREEKSRNTEKQIKFLVYTLELASKLADASGMEHGAPWHLLGFFCHHVLIRKFHCLGPIQVVIIFCAGQNDKICWLVDFKG